MLLPILNILQYHIRSMTDVQLVSKEEVDQPVILLRWNEMWEQMYGATVDRVSDSNYIWYKKLS